MVNTILAKRVNHIVAKGDNPAWPKGSKSRGFSTVRHSFPYDYNSTLDANLQAVNEKLNELDEYREELQEAEYGGGMRR